MNALPIKSPGKIHFASRSLSSAIRAKHENIPGKRIQTTKRTPGAAIDCIFRKRHFHPTRLHVIASDPSFIACVSAFLIINIGPPCFYLGLHFPLEKGEPFIFSRVNLSDRPLSFSLLGDVQLPDSGFVALHFTLFTSSGLPTIDEFLNFLRSSHVQIDGRIDDAATPPPEAKGSRR
jgi:hypothetical protein